MLNFHSFKKINTLFSQGKTQDALHELMHIQAKHIALHETVESLRARIAELEDIILLSKALHFDNEFYWLKFKSGTQGPFCPTCYQREGAFYRLEDNKEFYFCTYCGTEFFLTAKAVGDTQENKDLCNIKPQAHENTLELNSKNTRGTKQAKVIPFTTKSF